MKFIKDIGRDAFRVILIEIVIPIQRAPYKFSSNYFTNAFRLLARVIITVGAKNFIQFVAMPRE